MCGEHPIGQHQVRDHPGSSPHVRGTPYKGRPCRRYVGIIPACAGNTTQATHCKRRPRDHPRMCGEHLVDGASRTFRAGSSPHVRGTRAMGRYNAMSWGIIPACAGNTRDLRTGRHRFAGSSPHVRGTLAESTEDVQRLGIIPACAGNTSNATCSTCGGGDHPRMCGEHYTALIALLRDWGSSPHVRGTLTSFFGLISLSSIIPACAGNTGGVGVVDAHLRDHPRMCGEHPVEYRCAYAELGSSPHVRGTHFDTPRSWYYFGIIPACAGNTRETFRPCRAVGDHPRMCGEHPLSSIDNSINTGSSPHVRGTLPTGRCMSCTFGIIPACAGNTPTIVPFSRWCWDHPRMCGEHTVPSNVHVVVVGSSPHVRGTRRLHRLLRGRPGIIPACAGNTSTIAVRRRVSRDHPRMCGEHGYHGRPKSMSRGSSPHVRGTQVERVEDGRDLGIIPACAGNTARSSPATTRRRDHPRMCGEHFPFLFLGGVCVGSSPHVRGTPPTNTILTRLAGIIPACAGNTSPLPQICMKHGDHPRMCGEHLSHFALLAAAAGSSPHVRGTHHLQAHRCKLPGIIPACAGNTPSPRTCRADCRDHPRMCGEHRMMAFCHIWRPGSSPHVRGTHCEQAAVRSSSGIIPACAGNTCRTGRSRPCRWDHPRMCGEHPPVHADAGFEVGSSPHVRGTPYIPYPM